MAMDYMNDDEPRMTEDFARAVADGIRSRRMRMPEERYIPYVDDGKVVVLFWRNGFAIKSNFNNTNDFRNLTQAKTFCEYQNEQLKGESDEM